MLVAKPDRLVNRVTVALLAAIGLVIAGWALTRPAPTPAVQPALGELIDAAAGRAGSSTDGRIAEQQARLRAHPGDPVALSQLGALYLQKARETADPTYYQKAQAALEQADQLAPGDYASVTKLGELALARHAFATALALGERARDLNPHRAAAFGVIADAQIELGRYAEAAETLQAMVDLRPDLSSYSRIAYLRELHGDWDGALEAMQMAVDAGGPATENTLWTRVQLGHLHFNRGRLDEAEAEYRRCLELDTHYAPALTALARVAAARGEYAEAIQLYSQAVEQTPLPEYVIALGEVYIAAGRPAEAEKTFALVRAIDQLYRANGVNTDLELALFLADHGDPAEAVDRARQAYAERPTVFAADVLAWALYQAGQPQAAWPYAQEALRLGSQDALKHFHAGMIVARLGRPEAQALLQRALDLNPYFSPLHAMTARQTVQTLIPTP